MSKVLVLGGGGFGTCLSNLLTENGNDVYLWEYNEKVRDVIRKEHENTVFLPGIKLSEKLKVVDEYQKLLGEEKFDFILLATPCQFLRGILKNLKTSLTYKVIIINIAKGIEIASKKRMSEVVEEELNGCDYEYGILTGPTHAEDLAKKMPSAILAASVNHETAEKIQKLFNNDYLRVYTGTDLIGAELGGALKNCLAIAAGMADGLELGDNSKAALLTRGINEIIRIGEYYGADPKTFFGLSGLGDIIVTCTSKHSRNRFVGEQLGKGRKLAEILESMNGISEGSETIKALHNIIVDENINAPIFTELYKVLYEDETLENLFYNLMSRKLKSEF